MTPHHFPRIDGELFEATRNAVHAYSRVLGNVQKACRPKRKHWWHASLRPSLNGLTSGVVRTSIGFDIELNLRKSVLELRASSGGASWLDACGRRRCRADGFGFARLA